MPNAGDEDGTGLSINLAAVAMIMSSYKSKIGGQHASSKKVSLVTDSGRVDALSGPTSALHSIT